MFCLKHTVVNELRPSEKKAETPPPPPSNSSSVWVNSGMFRTLGEECFFVHSEEELSGLVLVVRKEVFKVLGFTDGGVATCEKM